MTLGFGRCRVGRPRNRHRGQKRRPPRADRMRVARPDSDRWESAPVCATSTGSRRLRVVSIVRPLSAFFATLVVGTVASACGPLVGADFDGLLLHGGDAGTSLEPDVATEPVSERSEAEEPSGSGSDAGAADPGSADGGAPPGSTSCVLPEAPTYSTKPPRAAKSFACDVLDRLALEEFMAAPDPDAPLELSPACEACIVSKSTDARWGPIVSGGGSTFPNPGPCAVAEGASAACARALTEVFLCDRDTCSACKGAGKKCPSDISTRCPAHVAAMNTACSAAVLDTCLDRVNIVLRPCQ
jgi:hypothetical protein